MKKTKRKRRISLVCAAVLLITAFSGCGNTEPGKHQGLPGDNQQQVENTESLQTDEVTPEPIQPDAETAEKVVQSEQVPTDTTEMAEVVQFVKSNFASGTLEESYNAPLYDLPADYVFTFDCSEEAGYLAYDAFRVFDNPNYEDVTGQAYHKNDYENGKLTVSPHNVLYLNENGSTTGNDGTWGSLNQLYLVQYIDLTSGEYLEKPIVTPFSIQHEVAAPMISQNVDENNNYLLSWEAVPGAVEYRIYEYFGEVAYQLACTTTNTSVTVEEFEEQKELEELIELFRQDLKKAGYDESFTDRGGISYMNVGVRPNDSLKSGYFLVVAVDAQGKQSGISNIVDVRELAYKLPYKVASHVMEVEISTIEDVPAYVEVEMLDGSIQTMVIQYHGALIYRDPEDEWKMTIRAGVANTLFSSFIIVLTGMKYDDIMAQASYITERQDELLSKVGGAVSPNPNIGRIEPEVTEAPVEPEAPEVTEPPVETEAPEATEEPEVTEAPVEPEVPVVTEAPAATQKPEAAETAMSLPLQVMEEVAAGVQENVDLLGADKVKTVLYGSNDLGAWMGLCLIAQSEVIPVPVEVFPDAANLEYAVSLLMESYRQNPTSGFLCDVAYSYEHQAFVVKYLEEKEVRLSKAKQEIEAAQNIVEQIITEDMSDYDKVLVINDYFREHASYDFDSTATEIEDYSSLSEQFIDSHTPYGIICKNYGVCESYSEAFILTARFAGLEAMCETGALYGGGHEWNRVKVDGSWCVLDVTNNDMDTCFNALFNVTDEQVKGILVSDNKAIVDYSSFAAADASKEYYYVNGMSVTDLESAAELLVEQLENSDTALLRVPLTVTKSDLEEVIKELVTERGISLSKAGTQFNILILQK